jgi:hypothetical protein
MITKNEFKEIFTNAIMENPGLFHVFDKPRRLFADVQFDKFFESGVFEICKECVTHDMLKHVLAANGHFLETIGHMDIDQNDELCKIAVEQNGRALQYVKNQTPEMCEFAVRQNGRVLEFVKNKTPDLLKIALSSNSTMIFELSMSDIVELE